MQHIQGISRHQLQVVSLEDTISQDNPIRFIDAFVHSIHLERIGFKEPRSRTNPFVWFDYFTYSLLQFSVDLFLYPVTTRKDSLGSGEVVNIQFVVPMLYQLCLFY